MNKNTKKCKVVHFLLAAGGPPNLPVGCSGRFPTTYLQMSQKEAGFHVNKTKERGGL